MILQWNRADVAKFLKTDPILPHAEDSELIFNFPVGPASAALSVRPFGNDIALTLTSPGCDEPFASWHFRVGSLDVIDEIEEEGGPVLSVSDTSRTCFLAIGPVGDSFEVSSTVIARDYR